MEAGMFINFSGGGKEACEGEYKGHVTYEK